MQLVENGKIDLDSPVVKYLPYFRMADERYKIITVRQMVTHTSGIPDVLDYEWNKLQYDDGALERYVRSLTSVKLDFAPGERFEYSDMAYEILGDVIANASCESFEDYVQKHILTSLGMKDSTLRSSKPTRSSSRGHQIDQNFVHLPQARCTRTPSIHSPSSNLHSNVLDMTRWAIANMNRGELDGVRILRTSTYDLMWKPSSEFGGKPSPVGISWFVNDYRGTTMISHRGGDIGFRTFLAMLPAKKKIAVVWMTNGEWISNADGVTHAAFDVALGLEPQPIDGKRSVGQAMITTYLNRGIDAAIKQYQTLKKLSPDAYNFDVGQLNSVERYFLENGRSNHSIRIFTEYGSRFL